MSNEKRWITNDALCLLLHLSRLCCLAPVRFAKIRTDTFVYISRPVLFFSAIIASIIQLYLIYLIYLTICSAERENYKELFLGLFNVSAHTIFVSYAVLHGEARIKSYMMCLAKLKTAIRSLHSSEEMNFKKWNVLIMFITLMAGVNLIMIIDYFVYTGSIHPIMCILTFEFTISVIVQQQFLYFALYVSFVLKIIKGQLQEELSNIINDQDEKQFRNYATAHYNIPLESINKAINLVGMTGKLIPDVSSAEKLKISLKIRQIYDSFILVCEVLQEISSSDGFLLFSLLIYISFSIVYSLYGILKLFCEDSPLSPAKLVVQCLEIFTLAVRIVMMVEPCHVAHEKVLEIRFLVCEIMCYVTSASDPVFKVIDGFFHHFVLNDISYTALGICKIGRPLVTSVLAAATTILITIIQF